MGEHKRGDHKRGEHKRDDHLHIYICICNTYVSIVSTYIAYTYVAGYICMYTISIYLPMSEVATLLGCKV